MNAPRVATIRAAHPDRVFVGIHAQNAGGDDEPGNATATTMTMNMTMIFQ